MVRELYGDRTFTPREEEIAKRVAAGFRNQQIADQLEIKLGTVKNALRNIYDKAGVWSRLELALWYRAHREQCNDSKESGGLS